MKQISGNIRVPLAGFLATAVAFGPARMAYGLFLPQIRQDFGLSLDTAGMIAGTAFIGFLSALFLTGCLSLRYGPKPPILLGGGTAALGLALAAGTSRPPLLAAGVFLAAASAGFSWAPYNLAASRETSPSLRRRILSIVSTGTAFGMTAAALASLIILCTGLTWRTAWLLFAAGGLLSAGVNSLALSGNSEDSRISGDAEEYRESEGSGSRPFREGFLRREFLRRLLTRRAVPLYTAAFSFGITTAVYLSFAADHISRSGILRELPPALAGIHPGPFIFAALGIAGLLGLLTGEAESRIGLRPLLGFLFSISALSLLLLGLIPAIIGGPDGPAWVLLSAALQGIFIMGVSSILSFWSLRIFPGCPVRSFTAVLILAAAGNVAGPFLAGLAAEQTGTGLVFVLSAGLSLITLPALVRPRP